MLSFYPYQVVVSLEAHTDGIFTPCHGLGHIWYTEVPLKKDSKSSTENTLEAKSHNSAKPPSPLIAGQLSKHEAREAALTKTCHTRTGPLGKGEHPF